MKANAIKPSIPRPDGTIRQILYPYRLYELEVLIKRPLKEPRIVRLLVQVDMIRAKGYLADTRPETIEAEGEAIPPRLGEEAAEAVARRTALYYTLKKYRVGLAPEIRTLRSHEYYKIVWLVVDGSGRRILVDSVTGETELL